MGLTPARMTRRARIAFAVTTILSFALLWYFHDRFWYPTDDGFYGNIAERLLGGETLGRDLQDLHPGYIHVLNAAAMRLFGLSLVSMRYPLILVSLAEAGLVFALFVRRTLALAISAAILVVSVGVVQFFDPTPNWYTLTLAVATAAWLTTKAPLSSRAIFVAGLFVGAATMFRQLSGIWLAMGLVYVLLQPSGTTVRRS
ncbi:MAG: hypothetical protein LBQ09_02365, partial [Acidobacteriaceae bacterium]|nr:hypothetical protein [Acidobacteriaceae bacterium]